MRHATSLPIARIAFCCALVLAGTANALSLRDKDDPLIKRFTECLHQSNATRKWPVFEGRVDMNRVIGLLGAPPNLPHGPMYYLVGGETHDKFYVVEAGGMAGVRRAYGPLPQSTTCQSSPSSD